MTVTQRSSDRRLPPVPQLVRLLAPLYLLGCHTHRPPALAPVAQRTMLQRAIDGSEELAELVLLSAKCAQMKPVMYWVHKGEYLHAHNETTWIYREASSSCDEAVERAFALLKPAADLEQVLAGSDGSTKVDKLRATTHPLLREVALRSIPWLALDDMLEAVNNECSTLRGVTRACLDRVADFEATAQFSTLAGRGRHVLRRERANDQAVLQLVPEMTRILQAHAKLCTYKSCKVNYYYDAFGRPQPDDECLFGEVHFREPGATQFDEEWAALVATAPLERQPALLDRWSSAMNECSTATPVPEGR